MGYGESKFCASCSRPVTTREGAACCGECGRIYHLDCWRREGKCAASGCPGRPFFHPPAVNYPAQCPYCDNVIPPAHPYCASCGREKRTH